MGNAFYLCVSCRLIVPQFVTKVGCGVLFIGLSALLFVDFDVQVRFDLVGFFHFAPKYLSFLFAGPVFVVVTVPKHVESDFYLFLHKSGVFAAFFELCNVVDVPGYVGQ